MTIPPKKVLNADAGDADHVGGNDWDDLADYMNDVDKTGPVKINTATQFRSSKKKLMNPANTFGYTEVASALAANRNVTEPLLTADDTRVYQAFTQSLTNKTIDVVSNTFANRAWTVLMTKVGSTYYAIKYDGTIISSSTTAQTVILAALVQRGVIYFAHTQADNSENTTDWNLSGAFTGFTLTGATTLIGSHHVRIMVPQGYTGTVFTIDGNADYFPDNSVNMHSIIINEQGTEARDWKGVKLQADTSLRFIEFANFHDVQIFNAAVGFELETTNSSFITSCSFTDCLAWNCEVGFLIDQQTGNIGSNTFTNCVVQTLAGFTTHGFKDVDGEYNVFLGCVVWDSPLTTVDMNIKSTGNSNQIIGGRIGETGARIDLGKNTIFITSQDEGGPRFNFMSTPDHAKIGAWYGVAPSVGEGMFNGRIAAIATGTGTDAGGADDTGTYRTFATGSTTNSLSGVRCNNGAFRRILNTYFKTAIYLDNNTAVRVFAGVVGSNSAPASSSDPLNALYGVGLWLDTAVSANWKRMHNDAVGASSVDDTGVSASSFVLHPVEIFATDDTRFRFVFNGTHVDITSNIPSSTANLASWIYMENTTGTTKSFRSYYMVMRQDK